jgi:hypothetical protein
MPFYLAAASLGMYQKHAWLHDALVLILKICWLQWHVPK